MLREEPARVTIRGLRRSFYPPSHLPPVDNSPPEKKLQLEWVYGYRGTDTRRNLWVLPSGELLYYVAAVAILFDREENAQRHYIGHTEDIMCMEVDRNRHSNFCGHARIVQIFKRHLKNTRRTSKKCKISLDIFKTSFRSFEKFNEFLKDFWKT